MVGHWLNEAKPESFQQGRMMGVLNGQPFKIVSMNHRDWLEHIYGLRIKEYEVIYPAHLNTREVAALQARMQRG